MADTFSNDLRLRLQESGSNAGTWGDLLNGTITNIASALGQGSEVIPNASTHTITLADGTADEARSLYLKCTGGGQACTVTLGPNTISKVWIIDNATSYTLTFSQGSGANVAIAAGAVKVIATDGAGSGAAVVDTLDGLEGSLSTLAVSGGLTVDTNTLVVDATNNNVGIGTSSPNSYTGQTTLNINSAGVARLDLDIGDTMQGFLLAETGYTGLFTPSGTNSLRFGTNNTERLRIDASGNALVGRTASLTGQSSSVSANTVMSVHGVLAQHQTNVGILQYASNVFSLRAYGASANTGVIAFNTGGGGGGADTEAMRIAASGNVGIASVPPAWGSAYISLNVGTAGSFWGTKTGASLVVMSDNTYFDGTSYRARNTGVASKYFQNAGAHYWDRAASVSAGATQSNVLGMILDASGNLLVGTTSNSVYNDASGTGIALNAGQIQIAGTGTPLYANRQGSDSEIIDCRKDGTTVGSVNTKDGDLAIGTGTCGIRFNDGANAVIPFNITTNSQTDNTLDLGFGSLRWQDIFATNGTIQTSDRNEKQDIAELTDAEQRVAVAAKGLMRKFRWIDSVAEKGDEARIHFGIIAQDLQAAFEAEGLDAGRYAMFTSNTWTDEDTGEERTRLGVRYSELLAFIISAI